MITSFNSPYRRYNYTHHHDYINSPTEDIIIPIIMITLFNSPYRRYNYTHYHDYKI